MSSRNYILSSLVLAVSACGGGTNGTKLNDLTASEIVDLSASPSDDLTSAGSDDADNSNLGDDGGMGSDVIDGGSMIACKMPMPFPFMNGTGMVTGDTSTSLNYTSSTCGGVLSPDRVYELDITTLQTIQVSVVPSAASPDFDPIISLRDDCASEDPTHELGCSEVGAGSTVSITKVVKPGKYFLWVDGYNGTVGQYTLKVTSGTPPANDTCTGAQALTFKANSASATFDTSFAGNDGSGTCSGSGPDVVYSFSLTMAQSLSVTVTPDASSPDYTPAIYVRKVCDDMTPANELGCASAPMAGPATLDIPALAAGSYFLWVSGDSTSSAGKATVSLTLGTALVGASCGLPAMLTFTGSTATATTDTTSSADTGLGNCGGSGPDLVYQFTTPMPQKITATVTPDSASKTYQPTVYIRSKCGDSSTEIACGMSGTAGAATSAIAPTAPAGTYFVTVDGYSGSSGKSTLTVTLDMTQPPPANDSCSAPQMVAVPSTTMGDTTFATPDLGGALSSVCDVNFSGDFPGRDLVYAFTAKTTGTVKAKVTPTGNWDPLLWVTPATCTADGSKCTAADDTNGSAMADTLSIAVKAGTTYFVVVDSNDLTSFGAFSLQLQ